MIALFLLSIIPLSCLASDQKALIAQMDANIDPDQNVTHIDGRGHSLKSENKMLEERVQKLEEKLTSLKLLRGYQHYDAASYREEVM